MINISIPYEGVIEEIVRYETELKEKLCRSLWSDLVSATPKDSGKARASWLMDSHGSGSELEDGEYGYPKMPSVPRGSDVHIYNTAPYIMYLNNGHSQQAPSMFIEIAIENAVGRIHGLR